MNIQQLYDSTIDVLLTEESICELKSTGDFTLCEGCAGIALLLFQSHIDDSARVSMEKVHEYLSAMEEIINRSVAGIGYFTGLTGVAYVLSTINQITGYYQSAITELRRDLLPKIHEKCNDFIHSWPRWVPSSEYDLIFGLAGIGQYLLNELPTFECENTLKAVLECLVRISQFRNENGRVLPGWVTLPEYFHDHQRRLQYPNGWIDCGLAHGISGPLSILSESLIRGIEVPGQRAAIDGVVEYLLSCFEASESYDSWSSTNTILQDGSVKVDIQKQRSAWCYGFIGVAVALARSNKIVHSETVQLVIDKGYGELLKKPISELGYYSPTFCHGFAGFIGTGRFTKPDVDWTYYTREMYNTFYRPDYRFKFRNYEHTSNGTVEDKPGLLSGSAGILAASAQMKDGKNLISPVFLC